MNTLRWCGCALIALTASSELFAKGITTRIVIAGGNLRTSISITDSAVLKDFNVWAGRGTYMNGVEGMEGFIIDWPSGFATTRPEGLARYEVSFFVKYANRPLEGQTEQRAYVVHYEWDPVQGKGYVYLPGRTDESYQLNVRSIHRGGLNGHWFQSTRAWQDAVTPLLARATPKP